MKNLVIFLIIVNLQVSAGTNLFSQEQVTLDLKNVTLKKCIKEIDKQTKFGFLYNGQELNKIKIEKVNFKDALVEDVLNKLLKENGYAYEFYNDVLLIRKDNNLKKETETVFQLDTVTISGTVVDEDGNPLAGATISISGTTIGTITNANGKYAITVPGQATLVFSFVGMKTEEVAVTPGQTEINIVMHEESTLLDEVKVIATGYQKIRPEQSTGSITSIKAKEFESRVNTTDFLSGLQNKIPGLLINNDIEFEGNSLFQVRGISTITGNKEPLIVIDGFPTELTLDMINPNEIESITVLKDAAAASIYGVRSSNGVIIIERKKAKAGEARVNFRSTFGLTPKEDYDRYRWDKNGSEIYIDYYQNYYSGFSPYTWTYMNNPVYGSYMTGPPPYEILAQLAAGVITQEEADQMFEELGSYNNTKEYEELFLRTATAQTYNLDISGGSNNVLYYLTANYANNKSTKIKNDDNSFSLSGRATVKFSDRFSLDLNTDFRETKANSVPVPGIDNTFPYERFQDEDGNPLSIYNGSTATNCYNEAIMAIGLLDNRYYPLVDIDEVNDKTHTVNNRITAKFLYDIGKGLSLDFGGVYETSSTEIRHLASENSSEVHQYVNHYTADSPDGFVYNIPKGSFLRQQESSRDSYTLRAQLNYDKQLWEDHSLNLILGGELRDVLDKSSSSAYFGYSDQSLLHQPVDYNSLQSGPYAGFNRSVRYENLFKQGYADDRYISVYSNLVYSYKGKYSVTGSIRIDQSNLFGTDPKYKYKPLWSVGAGWNIHKENFMQDVSWLNSLKLRMAYGFNGNVAKDALPQVIAYDDFNTTTLGVTFPELLLSSPANSSLRWEETQNYNFGLDYSIFRNISGSIDYYIKKSTDILASVPIDATKSGRSSALMNQASIRNSGLEVNLQADWITRKDFNWNTGLVFAYNESKVLKVYNLGIYNEHLTSYISGVHSYMEGYAVGALFNFRHAGLNSEGELLIYDENGEAQVFSTSADKSYVDYAGSSIPTLNAGLSNRVDIGNFYIYCMINFYGGFKVNVPVPDPGDGRPLEGAGNYWKELGDEADPDMLPALSTTGYNTYQYLSASDKYTVSGAYLTLGDVTLAYSFRDNKLLKKSGLSNLEMRLQASNLYTIGFNEYNYSKATGSYAKSYLTPTYTFGLYINF